MYLNKVGSSSSFYNAWNGFSESNCNQEIDSLIIWFLWFKSFFCTDSQNTDDCSCARFSSCYRTSHEETCRVVKSVTNQILEDKFSNMSTMSLSWQWACQWSLLEPIMIWKRVRMVAIFLESHFTCKWEVLWLSLSQVFQCYVYANFCSHCKFFFFIQFSIWLLKVKSPIVGVVQLAVPIWGSVVVFGKYSRYRHGW